MPKFKEGDVVYCILNEDSWDDSLTVLKCGDGEYEMAEAVNGFPCTVETVGVNPSFQSYLLSSARWGSDWWFHEDDLEFFNISLENK